MLKLYGGEFMSWEVAVVVGIARAVNGVLKHKNDKYFHFSPRRAISTIAVGITLGVIGHLGIMAYVPNAPEYLALALGSIGLNWLGTNAIEDILKKKFD